MTFHRFSSSKWSLGLAADIVALPKHYCSNLCLSCSSFLNSVTSVIEVGQRKQVQNVPNSSFKQIKHAISFFVTIDNENSIFKFRVCFRNHFWNSLCRSSNRGLVFSAYQSFGSVTLCWKTYSHSIIPPRESGLLLPALPVELRLLQCLS